ncbi:choice-of-anchor J domain-containing protein [bacterium]|nr:choice-of-anchor J domain-containing protein [bacterium]
MAGAAPPLSEDFESGLGSWRSVTKAGPGTTEWEVGTPTDPPGTKNGAPVAGTDLDADYVPGTHVSLLSPEVNLETFTKGPTLSFSYYLALGDAFRVNVLDATEVPIAEAEEVPIAEAEEGGPLFFTENTEGWVDVSVPLSVFGQKAIIEFEFVAGGSAAGAFIDDVLISESE